MTVAPKQILITGAGRRLGRLVAEELSAAGHGVVIHARSSTHEAEALVEQLRAGNSAVWMVRGDLAEAEQLPAMLQEAASLAALQNRQSFAVNNMSMTKQAEQSLIQVLR